MEGVNYTRALLKQVSNTQLRELISARNTQHRHNNSFSQQVCTAALRTQITGARTATDFVQVCVCVLWHSSSPQPVGFVLVIHRGSRRAAISTGNTETRRAPSCKGMLHSSCVSVYHSLFGKFTVIGKIQGDGRKFLDRFKSYFGSQISSQSLNEIHIYRLVVVVVGGGGGVQSVTPTGNNQRQKSMKKTNSCFVADFGSNW